MNYPSELAGWTVDECIEALTGITPEVEDELLTVAPDAYTNDDGVQLDTVWTKLSPEAQAILEAAGIEEANDRDDEDLEVA